jgi:hypothetical protein
MKSRVFSLARNRFVQFAAIAILVGLLMPCFDRDSQMSGKSIVIPGSNDTLVIQYRNTVTGNYCVTGNGETRFISPAVLSDAKMN